MELNDLIFVGKLKKEYISKIVYLTDDNLDVILTQERKRHYRSHHPEMEPFENRLSEVITDPSEVHINMRANTVNFYREYSDLPGKGQYLRVTIRLNIDMDNGPKTGYKHSVITFRISREKEVRKGREKNRQIWVKE